MRSPDNKAHGNTHIESIVLVYLLVDKDWLNLKYICNNVFHLEDLTITSNRSAIKSEILLTLGINILTKKFKFRRVVVHFHDTLFSICGLQLCCKCMLRGKSLF